VPRSSHPEHPAARRTKHAPRSGPIWLVGMMGAGKSAVGPRLARRLGRSFLDTDREIERAAGRSVATIFADEGEAGFRARERAAVRAAERGRAVVALGGGAIAQPGVAERLAARGTVVHLRARPETLLARIGDADARPLLRGVPADERRRRLEVLLAERRAAYESARIVVDTDGRSLEEVVEEIVERLAGEPTARRGAAVLRPSARRTVEVSLGARSYPIEIGYGTLGLAGAAVARHTKATQAVVLAAGSVSRRYGPALERGLREAGLRSRRLEVKDGDAQKTLAQAARLYDALLDAGADRGSVVVALGGGVVGDLAGFVAATYLRGVAFVQVPTTVLAMVDSSIGGKVGVNLARGKNLVGAFHQPRLVWVDVATLRSLPVRQRAAGMAEVVKAAALWDAAFFTELETCGERLLGTDPEVLVPVLERACAIKAEVVAQDERETGLRMLLNLGHTLGHAIEALTRYRGILHGEAVAIGMVYAARRSEALGLAPLGTATRLEALLSRLGLPSELPDFPRRAYLAALRVDKKRQDARIRYVVLREIGRAETVPLTPAEIYPARP